jgi:predicted Fe-Mo cluster-binding NifX family protein
LFDAFNVKIAIPTAEHPRDAVHGHVATAPFFTVVDLDSEEMNQVPNPLFGLETKEINPVGIVRSLGWMR